MMKGFTARKQAFTLALTLTVFVAGCSAPANNTQRGAAGGAALGALAGAIIGNNRGSGNAASGAAIGAAAGAVAGGALGHAKDTRERRAATSYGDGTTNIVVDGPPPIAPAPIAEVVTAQPNSNAVWIPGYWSYENGSSYAWVAGHWEIPPQGYRTYQPAHWVQEGGRSIYVRGTWR